MKTFITSLATIIFINFPVQAEEFETTDFFGGKNGSTVGVSCPILIVPGKSIGPIELGMPKGNLSATGLKIKQLKSSPGHLIVGPFLVLLTDEKIVSVGIEPAHANDCVKIGKKKIAKKATFDQIKKILPRCKKTDETFGGKKSLCDKLVLSQGSTGDSQPEISTSTYDR